MKNKYNIILQDNEIEELLNASAQEKKQIKEKLHSFEANKAELVSEIIDNVKGNIKYNSKELYCPICKGIFIVRTFAGDLYYRLFNGSKEQKEKEKKRFSEMGLYSNPWSIVEEDTKDYLCLKCGYRWNDKR